MKSPLAHPLLILSCLLLVVNDHVLKDQFANWWTGKLSDVAFMIVMPTWIWVGLRYCNAHVGRTHLWLILIGTALFFSSMQLSVWGDATYRYVLGALQYPYWAFLSLRTEGTLPSIAPVSSTPDPTDLVVLPFLMGSWWIVDSTLNKNSIKESDKVPLTT